MEDILIILCMASILGFYVVDKMNCAAGCQASVVSAVLAVLLIFVPLLSITKCIDHANSSIIELCISHNIY